MPNIILIEAFREKRVDDAINFFITLTGDEFLEYMIEKIEGDNIFELVIKYGTENQLSKLINKYSNKNEDRNELVIGNIEQISPFILLAAKENKFEIIYYLIENYTIDISKPVLGKKSILNIAIDESNFNLLSFLKFSCDQDLEIAHEDRDSALCYAIKTYNYFAINSLLNQRLVSVPRNKSPEMDLLLTSDISFFENILYSSYEIIKKSRDFIHAIYQRASSEGWFEIIEFIFNNILKETDINSSQLDDLSLDTEAQDDISVILNGLHLAIKNGHFGIVNFLLDKFPVFLDQVSFIKNAFLFLAIECEHYDIAGLIIEKTKLDDFNIHIIEAAKYGRVDIIRILHEEFGIDINKQDALLITPLHGAITNSRYEVVEYLLSQKVDLNSKEVHNYSPLMYAVLEEDFKIIKLIFSATYDMPDLNVTNLSGDTAFSISILNRNFEIVKFFIDIVGIKPTKENIKYAQRFSSPEIINYLNYCESNQIDLGELEISFTDNVSNPLLGLVSSMTDLTASYGSIDSLFSSSKSYTNDIG